MDTAYLSTAYLPPVQYFCKLYHFPKVVIEQHCNYVKQTYRNRCNIAAANGVMPLTVPVERTGEAKCLTKDVRISDHGNWQHLHWQAIVSAYNNTPFFEYYRDDFEPFYQKKYDFLFDFNEALRLKIEELLEISPEVSFSHTYEKEPGANSFDFRETIHPKRDYSLDGEFTPQPYYQVFQEKLGFLPNLSIIDLLFNMGPESILILRDSHCSHKQK
ncbi:MAG: WbqC family protein [Bacteroidota bacterium]|nr:WbqC family protein [Bacteroidota bacterium]